MANIFLTNAFSLNMLSDPDGAQIKIQSISADDVAGLDWVSAVGHADTANVLSSIIGKPVTMNRTTVTLANNDVLIVAQLHGARLPEGATTLPDGATIKFWLVMVS